MRKIELIQEEGTNNWHWVILEYNENLKSWYNTACGMEGSFVQSAAAAKQEYDNK